MANKYSRDRERERDRSDREQWRNRENRQDYYRNYDRREDEEARSIGRPAGSGGSWASDEEAERRRRIDDVNRQREARWQPNPQRSYGRDDRSSHESENTWGSGREGFSRGESEDWRHLDNYWNDMYGEHYPGRAEFSSREFGANPRSSYSRENYGSGSGDWRQGSGSGMSSSRPSYSGRGPKNYKRSDERIQEDINEQLTRHADVDATEIDVTVEEGEVTLRGHVDERQAKRMAEDIAEAVSGVKNVRNEIRVQQREQRGRNMGESAA